MMPWITRFSLKFYIIYLIISLMGVLILRYNDVSAITIICYFTYVFFFCIGTIIGSGLPMIKLKILKLSPISLANFLLPLSAISVLLGWLFLIRYYGSLANIMASAYAVRVETIGDGIQVTPTLINYLSSFTAFGFSLSLIIYYDTKIRKYLYYVIMFGILIIISDLQTFGRIGMLFAIFILFGYVFLLIRRIPWRKLAFSSILLFLILMVPWIIRKGNSLEGAGDKFSSYMQFSIPDILTPLVSAYTYYFSSIYALNDLLGKTFISYFEGQRNFSSFINLYNRIFLDETHYHRVVIIADSVDIPFETNIYSIIGEAYMDFGYIGLIFLPLFWGVNFGYFFKYKGFYANILKMVMLAWLFYTPIYNAFSFGGFLLTFIVAVFCVIFVKEKTFKCQF